MREKARRTLPIDEDFRNFLDVAVTFPEVYELTHNLHVSNLSDGCYQFCRPTEGFCQLTLPPGSTCLHRLVSKAFKAGRHLEPHNVERVISFQVIERRKPGLLRHSLRRNYDYTRGLDCWHTFFREHNYTTPGRQI